MKKALVGGLTVALLSAISGTQAFAAPIASSNTVKITGGYEKSVTVQKWEQTGWATQYVQVQTGGGYYTYVTYQSGTQNVCTTTQVATNHATWHSGYWVDTGYWNNRAKRWIDSGYWSPGWYGPPYFNTYSNVTTCSVQPTYSTEQVWVAPTYTAEPETVATYGYVPVVEKQWVPLSITTAP